MIIYYVPPKALSVDSDPYINVYASEHVEYGRYLNLRHNWGFSNYANNQSSLITRPGVVRICKAKAIRLMKDAGFSQQDFPVII